MNAKDVTGQGRESGLPSDAEMHAHHMRAHVHNELIAQLSPESQALVKRIEERQTEFLIQVQRALTSDNAVEAFNAAEHVRREVVFVAEEAQMRRDLLRRVAERVVPRLAQIAVAHAIENRREPFDVGGDKERTVLTGDVLRDMQEMRGSKP